MCCLPNKMENGKIIKDGKEYPHITEYKNWKMDELTQEQMERSDITGYTIITKE